MKYTIFQVDPSMEETQDIYALYSPYEDVAKRCGPNFPSYLYEQIYSAPFDFSLLNALPRNYTQILDSIHSVFNGFSSVVEMPTGYFGRCLSVSDVVYLSQEKDDDIDEGKDITGFYYCDSIGWKKLINFESAKTKARSVNCLMFEPANKNNLSEPNLHKVRLSLTEDLIASLCDVETNSPVESLGNAILHDQDNDRFGVVQKPDRDYVYLYDDDVVKVYFRSPNFMCPLSLVGEEVKENNRPIQIRGTGLIVRVNTNGDFINMSEALMDKYIEYFGKTKIKHKNIYDE